MIFFISKRELKRMENLIMPAIDTLNQAVADLTAETGAVVTALGDLTTQVASLQAALAAAGTNDPAILAAAASIESQVTALKTAVTPPAAPTV